MRGFLVSEANRLMHDGGRRTESLKELYRRSRRPENSRSREYVFLYALETGRLDVLEGLFDEPDPPRTGIFEKMKGRDAVPAREAYSAVMALAEGYSGDAERFLRDNRAVLDKRYYQVLDAFDHPATIKASDERLKAAWRLKVLGLLSETGTSAYALAGRAGVNRGNMYAYLRGDLSAVSYETARRLRDAAEGLAGD